MNVKLTGAVGLAGLLTAVAASFVSPKVYVSTSVVQSATEAHNSPEISDWIDAAWQDVVSRPSLSELIQRPALNLYHAERMEKPLEDVMEQMRKDLHLDLTQTDSTPRFRVSFSYPDRFKAQLVVDVLIREMIDPGRIALRRLGPGRQVVAPATLPAVPLKPDRLAFVIWGLGIGLLAGVIASFLRWRAKWTMKVIACGLAGCAAATALSFLIPSRYTSQAVLRVLRPPGADGARHYMKDAEMAAWLEIRGLKLLGNASLAEIIQRPPLDLYRKELESASLETVIAKMRRDLTIQARSPSSVSISFTYPDRYKAQATVAALITRFLDASNVPTGAEPMAFHQQSKRDANCTGKAGEDYIGCMSSLLSMKFPRESDLAVEYRPPRRQETIDLLGPPSLPETPVAPDRRVLAGAGLFVGLFLGAYGFRNPVPRLR